jgi:Fe-S cluster assembly iron-binding protein IscA
MIRLTERAIHELERILAANRMAGDQGLKLVPGETGGVEFTFDRPGARDAVVNGRKRALLIVDAEIAPKIDGLVLDLASGGGGQESRFVLRGPDPSSPATW